MLLSLGLLVLSGEEVRADVSIIPYQIEISDVFLGDLDSAVLVLQHGQYLTRFKLKRSVRTILKRIHFLPCRSGFGHSFSSLEGLAWLRKLNGAYYNFFLLDTNKLMTVRSVAYDDMSGRNLLRNHTYFVGLIPDSQPEIDLRKSLEMYREHLAKADMFSNGRLQLLLRSVLGGQNFRDILREIHWDGFTVAELNQQFSLDLPDNGLKRLPRFDRGQPVGNYRFITEAGFIKSFRD